MHTKITPYIENTNPHVSRKAQLEAYDECARLRPVWDGIASKYDIAVTPSVVDEAPVDISNTGDAVSSSIILIGTFLICSNHFVLCGLFFKSHA